MGTSGAAECRTPDAHVELLVTLAGPAVVPDDVVQPPTGSVGCSPFPRTTPAEPTLGKNSSFQNQPWVYPSSGGGPADYRLQAAPLMSRPATTSQHAGDMDTVHSCVNVPDLSREGPFDINQPRAISIPAPRHAYVRTTRDVCSD